MIREGDVVVVNNTRVFPARLFGVKESGGRIEVMIERLLSDHTVRAYVKASKAPKDGMVLSMDGGFELRVKGRDADLFLLESDPTVRILDMAETNGHIPCRPTFSGTIQLKTENGIKRYLLKIQAVAAPTAGFHLDESLISSVKCRVLLV